VPTKPKVEDAASEFCAPGPSAASHEPAINADQLWRIEGSLSAVRSEMRGLRQLDDPRLKARLVLLEQGWRSELERALPSSLAVELHALLDWLGSEDASAAELRVGLAQLEGWVDGLLSGPAVLIVQSTDELADEASGS
jgi:hypothetical protein